MNQARNEEILINVTPQETRVAIVENGMLQELHIERSDAKGMVGNIYKGKVVRVLPGMQAAFVEIGLERTAFLHAHDAKPMLIMGDRENDRPKDRPEEGNNEKPISEPVREGQEILVQVVKDPLGSKGARLTTEISIPSRYLVYLPHNKVTGISQRITDETTREGLRSIIDTIKQQKKPDRTGGLPALKKILKFRIWERLHGKDCTLVMRLVRHAVQVRTLSLPNRDAAFTGQGN